MTSSYHVTSLRVQIRLGSLFKHEKREFNGEHEQESICEGWIENLSLGITVCHHLASLVTLNGDPWDGFFYTTLTFMMDSYNIQEIHVTRTAKMNQLRFHKDQQMKYQDTNMHGF